MRVLSNCFSKLHGSKMRTSQPGVAKLKALVSHSCVEAGFADQLCGALGDAELFGRGDRLAKKLELLHPEVALPSHVAFSQKP
jgi:hypothetical protein